MRKGRHCRPFFVGETTALCRSGFSRELLILEPNQKLAAEASPAKARSYSTVTRLRLSPELRSTSLLYGSMPASYGSSSSTSSLVLSVRSEEHPSDLQPLKS